MTANTLVDLVKIYATNTGTGAFHLGAALTGFRGAEALVDGASYGYSVQQGAKYEYGVGVYSFSSGTMSRSVLGSSSGGAAISLGSNAVINFPALSMDFAVPGPVGPTGPAGGLGPAGPSGPPGPAGPVVGLFTDTWPALDVGQPVLSAGYNAVGRGGGTYVSDALATSALAAVYPRLCKADGGGNYWRLIGDYTTVEQTGALCTPGIDDRVAIQPAIDYAVAVGIGEVKFLNPKLLYYSKVSTRVPGGFGGINPTGDMIVVNGSLAAAPFSIKLTGLPGTTVTMIGYNTGGSTDTDYQTVAGSPYRGAGIQLYGTQADDPDYHDMDLWKIQSFTMENIVIDGGRTAGGKVATSTDTSNKGICTFNAVREIRLIKSTVTKFGHELLYGGGTGYGTGTLSPMTVHLENMVAVSSNHSCLNFQDANLTDINGEYGDAYIAAEQYGNDSVFVGTVFRDSGQLNYSAADRSMIPGGQPYNFPAQGASLRKTQLIGVTHRNVDFVLYGPYTYGNAENIDSQINFSQFSLSCDLDLSHTYDQTTGNATALVLNGPGAVPTGDATGLLPRDINIRLRCGMTAHAKNAGRHYGPIIQWSGYLDPQSCIITVDSEALADYAMYPNAPFKAMPRVIWNGWTPSNGVTQPIPGQSVGGVTSGAIDASFLGLTAYPAGTTGGENMTFATLGSGGAYEGFAQGQEFTFRYGAAAGRFNFAKNGAGMALTRDRVTFDPGDTIVFTYDMLSGKWIDTGGHTNDTLAGSATYDAPNILPATSTTTNVTVTGAKLGDMVTDVALDVPQQGLIVSGSVSAANTVEVVLFNPTAGAIDLASANLAVTVTRV